MSFERIKKIKGKKYRYLVENVRIDGKVKQKVLEYRGKVETTYESNKDKPTAPAPILDKIVTFSSQSKRNGNIYIGRNLPLGKYRMVLYELPKESS